MFSVDNSDLMLVPPGGENAKGGTELLRDRLYSGFPRDVLLKFQIWFSKYDRSRVDYSKFQILYCHDLPEDPASQHLANKGWERFHKLVFVSNWQMQNYITAYQIPFSRCVVIQNSIIPIEPSAPDDGIIRLGYWSTPHRGLEILVPVFEKLAAEYDNIILDVFSSFKLYGWDHTDTEYKSLFERCEAHDRINYHGAVTNDEIRRYVARSDILAYPCIWTETSCLVLIEAMSAGLICVHPNLGALFETAAGLTKMYPFDEDAQRHALMFYEYLKQAIEIRMARSDTELRMLQKGYADAFYNWESIKALWSVVFNQVTNEMELFAPKILTFGTK